MTNLTPILEAVIALAVAIITAFVIPWIRSRTTAQEREEMLAWVDIAVASAQQLLYDMDGKARLNFALMLLEEKGYDVDDFVLNNALEAAVLKLHQQMEATAGKDAALHAEDEETADDDNSAED